MFRQVVRTGLHNDGGDSHCIDIPDNRSPQAEALKGQVYAVGLSGDDVEAVEHGQNLSDDGGDSCPGNSKRGKTEQPEDQHRIEDNIDHTSDNEKIHGDLHLSDTLEDLFECKLQQCAE